MADQEKEKSQELGLIDITEILSDYLRIFRRMWAWVLIFTFLERDCRMYGRDCSISRSIRHRQHLR